MIQKEDNIGSAAIHKIIHEACMIQMKKLEWLVAFNLCKICLERCIDVGEDYSEQS